jgi:hypothetical protein
MSIFPQTNINIEDNTQTTETKSLGKSFLFDFKKGDFVLRDGKLVTVDGVEAIKIWIEKILRTEKFKFKIYETGVENEYGVAIKDLLFGQKYPHSFVLTELRREVSEALSKHPEIKDIENFKIEREGTSVIISFKVNLKSKISTEMEVNF